MPMNRLARRATKLSFAAVAISAPLYAQDAPIPVRVASMRPVQVVREILADSAALRLSPVQVQSLAALEVHVRAAQEPRRVWTGQKPYFQREVPGMSSQEALRQAFAVLRYGQRDQVLARLDGVPPEPVPAGGVDPRPGQGS